jgi:non-specific serine/threonine protein kinase
LPLAPLIGREALLRRVRETMARDGVRLVTLTGPGGVGKTRLALEVALQAHQEPAVRVYFADLAPIADPDLVLPTVAHALGLQESGARSVRDLVKSCLQPAPTLLVLDNFEQVLPAAPVVADLLRTCGRLTVLATSRAPLRVTGEIEIAVPPLELPPERLAAPEDLIGFAAARLFVERAWATGADLALTVDNAPVIAAICRRLDGLPLALELAATRIKTLSPVALLARLDPSLPLLTGGPRDQPVRLRTMADAVAWSYDLLAPDEQALFRTFAVFVGGASLDAVEAVRRGGEEARSRGVTPLLLDSSTSRLLDSLAALADHSLIRREATADGEPRFAMLETIREYGLMRLVAHGEEVRVRYAHAAYLLELAEAIVPRLTGPDQAGWLDRLETEHGNLRAAMTWFEQAGDSEAALRLAGALSHFWWVRGHLSEGRGWYERLLASAAGRVVSPAVRARALTGGGTLARLQRDQRRAATLLAEGLGWARQAGDARELAYALNGLGSVALEQGDLERAGAWYQEAIPHYRAADHPEGVAGCLNNLSLVWRESGDLDGAGRLLDEALAIFRVRGDYRGVGIALNNLGLLATLRGDLDAAAAYHRDGLATRQEIGDQTGLADSLEQVGHLVSAAGQHVDAVRLIAAAAAFRRTIGSSIRTYAQGYVDRSLAAARHALDRATFDAAHAAGEALSLDAALAEARHVIAPPAAPAPTHAPPLPVELTERETEVLRLLAAGLTDRQIGEALFISPSTATRHVANIYRKLGIHSRAEATEFARRHGLA